MDERFLFLNLDGLDDSQVKQLTDLLHPSNYSPEIEFPWISCIDEGNAFSEGNASSLNVHAPVFETCVSKISNHIVGINHKSLSVCSNDSNLICNTAATANLIHNYVPSVDARTVQLGSSNFTNGPQAQQIFETYEQCNSYSESPKTVNGDIYPRAHPSQLETSATSFKLNPTVSCFVPHNVQGFIQPNQQISNGHQASNVNFHQNNLEFENDEWHDKLNDADQDDSIPSTMQNGLDSKSTEEVANTTKQSEKINSDATATVQKSDVNNAAPIRRSWAEIVSSGNRSTEKVEPARPPIENGNKSRKVVMKQQEIDNSSIDEDKMSLVLGKHLYQLSLDFQPVFLQPRGLINRRNWCYINATLQALLACPPFYILLRNLPLGPGIDRGKSSTPVIDSMVKVAYEFSQYQSPQEELQLGTPFQPDFIYDMLRDLKSDCLKGQQEDAEEFLSFILNNMHEEMVKIIKNYEKKNNIDISNDLKENGDISEGEEEWQVIGSKHKGMVTRKVAEHKTPISDLLGGQIKSFLTTSGSKTSASIQPFFTLQLDIQSDNVTSVSEALKEMTVKEPIQGYTCAKTKQEVEAYSHISLQKLPPILILHLKRFVYNKNGGCKKVMKKTDYPIQLELNKELFSPDVKKNQRIRLYKLFAVMYHDGEEAVKGHYISDVYNHGSQTWIRCDDRAISVVTETQVLSHSPPRVPYLLFYQES